MLPRIRAVPRFGHASTEVGIARAAAADTLTDPIVDRMAGRGMMRGAAAGDSGGDQRQRQVPRTRPRPPAARTPSPNGILDANSSRFSEPSPRDCHLGGLFGLVVVGPSATEGLLGTPEVPAPNNHEGGHVRRAFFCDPAVSALYISMIVVEAK